MNLAIPVNRKRVPYSLLFYSIMIVVWVWLMLEVRQFGREFTIILGVSLVFLVLRVSLLLADYVKTLFDHRAQIIIDADGFDDKRSLFSCGRVPWSDVRAVELYQGRMTKILVLQLTNAEALLKAQPFWKRLFQREMARRYGSPVLVSASWIEYDLINLYHQLNQLIQK